MTEVSTPVEEKQKDKPKRNPPEESRVLKIKCPSLEALAKRIGAEETAKGLGISGGTVHACIRDGWATAAWEWLAEYRLRELDKAKPKPEILLMVRTTNEGDVDTLQRLAEGLGFKLARI